jgi:TonB-linked SusC/RagA family outer membrane protein
MDLQMKTMNMSHNKIIGLLVLLVAMATVQVQAQVITEDKTKQKFDLGFGVEQSEFLSTVSAMTISGEELQQTSAVSLADALYGRLLGLNVFSNGGWTGDEGNTPSMTIRGNQTFSDRSILILVDGYERPIDRLTVEEVESVTVLKDAAALSMLGHEAVNGAILVKTKRGQAGKTHVKVGYAHKFQFDPEFAPMLDAYSYASAMNQGLKNDGLGVRYTDSELDLFKSGEDPYFYPNVDWRKEAFRNTASEDQAYLSVSGGSEKVRYYSILDYTGASGLFNGVQTDKYNSNLKYSKANIRSNVDFMITSTTKMSVNVLGIFVETNRPNDITANDATWNVYATPANAFPLKTMDGIWGGNEAFGARNVVAQIQDSGNAKTHQRQLWADARLTQDLSFWVKGLSAFLSAGYDNASITNEFYSKGHQYGYDIVGSAPWTAGNQETKLNFRQEVGSQWRIANTAMGLHYKGSFREDDNFAATLVYNTKAEIRDQRFNTFYRANVIGNFHYDLQDKYVADLTLAANGSNRNYPAKWAFSPVLSLGYIYANNTSGTLTYGKLRASGGIQHTDYQPTPLTEGTVDWQTNLIWQERWGGHNDYVYGTGFSNVWGTTLYGLPTTGFAQERATKFNFGTDIRLWNALDITAEAYWQRRSHIMVSSSNMNSWVVGLQSDWSDVGKVDSYGVEFSARFAKKIGKDFYINASALASWGRSKINYTIENIASPNLSVIGLRVDEARGLKAIGFFADEADIANSPTQQFSQVRPGDIKYEDVNGDGVINDNDMVGLGYTDGLPALNYAFTLGFEWHGVGVNALFQGAGSTMKNLRWAGSAWNGLANNNNLSVDYFNNSWDVVTDKSQALFPRLSSQSVPNNDDYASDIWFRKVNFLKLRSVELYYKLPEKLVSRANLAGVKIFVQGQNLFSVDNIEAMDAEVLGTAYPMLKAVNVGMSITF